MLASRLSMLCALLVAAADFVPAAEADNHILRRPPITSSTVGGSGLVETLMSPTSVSPGADFELVSPDASPSEPACDLCVKGLNLEDLFLSRENEVLMRDPGMDDVMWDEAETDPQFGYCCLNGGEAYDNTIVGEKPINIDFDKIKDKAEWWADKKDSLKELGLKKMNLVPPPKPGQPRRPTEPYDDIPAFEYVYLERCNRQEEAKPTGTCKELVGGGVTLGGRPQSERVLGEHEQNLVTRMRNHAQRGECLCKWADAKCRVDQDQASSRRCVNKCAAVNNCTDIRDDGENTKREELDDHWKLHLCTEVTNKKPTDDVCDPSVAASD